MLGEIYPSLPYKLLHNTGGGLTPKFGYKRLDVLIG